MRRRDIKADYKAAYVAEHDALKAAGRDAEADRVAKILADEYGHNVAKSDGGKGSAKTAPETTAASKPAENAAEERPTRAAKTTAAQKKK